MNDSISPCILNMRANILAIVVGPVVRNRSPRCLANCDRSVVWRSDPRSFHPPSQQAYVPLAKHILQQCLVRHIFLYTVLTCWIQAFNWAVWLLGGIEQLGSTTFVAPFYPYTLLLAGTTWMAAALPAIVIRNAYLTTKSTIAASLWVAFYRDISALLHRLIPASRSV